MARRQAFLAPRGRRVAVIFASFNWQTADAPGSPLDAPQTSSSATNFIDASRSVIGQAIVAWDWSFGDDPLTTSNLESPEIQYAAAGFYTVRLTVTDALGNQASTARVVPVYDSIAYSSSAGIAYASSAGIAIGA